VGAIASRSRRLGGTDSTSFNQAGLPGIGLGQDPIEYGTHTWHTNLDTYERIVEEDVKKAAVVVATAVYELATRDDLLSRFSKDAMPPPPRRAEPTPTPPPTTKPIPKPKEEPGLHRKESKRLTKNQTSIHETARNGT
jgi:hypothetical protein